MKRGVVIAIVALSCAAGTVESRQAAGGALRAGAAIVSAAVELARRASGY